MKNFLRLLLAVFYFLPTAAIAADDNSMVPIPAGCFQMGTDAVFEFELGRPNDRERPVHKVCLNAFYLDKHEVTQKQWEDVMGVKINIHRTPHHGDNLPIDFAKWEHAVAYCSKLGARLPTEAEWEYAARAGSKGLLPWGDEIDGDYLWYVGNTVRRPHSVGTRKPNAWGLHDMMGSVWEWTADWYLEHYYEISPRDNPKGPQPGSWHVIRGASWRDEEKDIRVTVRRRGQADATVDYSVGFRCARDAVKIPPGK